MKIRTRFVSNSSSSSFLINTKEQSLTIQKLNKLKNKGFFKTDSYYPEDVAFYVDEEIVGDNLGYHVNCNEEDIIDWLIKNNISFSADCHYGQFTVVYDKDTKLISTFLNAGKCFLMGYTLEQLKQTYKIRTIKEYKNEGYYI